MIPQIDQPLPAFSLLAAVPQDDGINEITIENATFTGEPFVLFFYPRDNTPGCTIEVCGFRELYPQFRDLGVAIVGVSRDTIGAHKKFIQGQELPYPLLVDKGAELIKSWDLLVHKTMYGKPVTGVSRNTYFVDGEGVVRKIWEKADPPGHAQEVLEFAQSFLKK